MISNIFKDFRVKSGAGKKLCFKVKVIPGASKTALKKVMADGVLKIAVAAVAEKGKANKELMKFLAKEFGVKRDGVRIVSGETSKLKIIEIRNI